MPAPTDSPPPSSESSPRNCGPICFGSHALVVRGGTTTVKNLLVKPRGIDPSTFENALARVRPRGWCFAHSCHSGIVAICSVWRGVGQKKCEFR